MMNALFNFEDTFQFLEYHSVDLLLAFSDFLQPSSTSSSLLRLSPAFSCLPASDVVAILLF